MIKLLIFLFTSAQIVALGASTKGACLNVYQSSANSTQFRFSPEFGSAKNVIFSLANLHPLVLTSQTEIIRNMLKTTSNNVVLLYGENSPLAEWQKEVYKILGPLNLKEKQKLKFVPTTATNLSWARDFSPAVVTNGKETRLVSFRYSKDEPLAMRTAEELALQFNLPTPTYPDLFVDGGAYMIDSQGRLFISDVVKTRNKTAALKFMFKNQGPDAFILDQKRPLVPKTDKEIEDVLKMSLGAREVIWIKALNPEFEKTGHIDMYAKIVNTKQAVVAQSRNPEVEIYLKQIAEAFEKYGYQVKRLQLAKQSVFGFRSYTNSTIVENTVFLPQYKDSRADKAAIAAYTSFGFKVVTNDGSSIECGGSTHCLTGIGPE